MKHKGTVLLKTNRLILRRLTLDDVDAMFDNWASNPNVTRFMTWTAHDNKETTKFVITDWVNSYEKLDYYQWGIVLKDSLTLIGTISIVNINEEDTDSSKKDLIKFHQLNYFMNIFFYLYKIIRRSKNILKIS